MAMELELGLAPPPGSCGKRGRATLPLFVREDDGGGGGGGGGCDGGELSAKRKRLVGWPPVKSTHRRSGGGGYVKVKMEGVAIGRKVDLSLHASYDELLDTLHRMFPSPNPNQDAEEDELNQNGGHGRRRGRHHQHAVTYEDGDGDWMLIGDVPWGAFAKSAKRLKILVV